MNAVTTAGEKTTVDTQKMQVLCVQVSTWEGGREGGKQLATIAVVIPGKDISDLLHPLEDAIPHHLIPAITGRAGITDMDRALLAFPTRLGCMGIPNPTKTCNKKFMSSEWISAPLTALILQQEKVYPSSVASEQTSIKSKIKAQWQWAQADEAAKLCEALPPQPTTGHGIRFRKGHLALASGDTTNRAQFHTAQGCIQGCHQPIWYRWSLPHLPSHCTCGKKLSVRHHCRQPYSALS